MTQESRTPFASSAWWGENALANQAVVHAIPALSSDDRPPETIWRTPTPQEWQTVARLAAECGDDDSPVGDNRMGWAFLWGLCNGAIGP